MGTYVTTTSLQGLLVGHSFSKPAGTLASSAIDIAEGEINGYIGKRYDVADFTSTAIPPLLATASKLLGSAYFLSFQSRAGKETLSKAEMFRKSAIDLVKRIADGEIDLLDVNGDLIEDKTDSNFRVLSNTEDYAPTFAEDDPTSWKVDSDKLEDISDDRDS